MPQSQYCPDHQAARVVLNNYAFDLPYADIVGVVF